MLLLMLRKTATSQGCKYDVRRDEAQHDMRECGPHGGQGGLAGVDAGHVPEKDPRLSLPAWIEHAVQCGCELQDRRRRGPAVLRCDVVGALRPGLLRQERVCLGRVHDLHEHVRRSTAHAEGDRERRGLPRVALQLSLLHTVAAPSSLIHQEEAARGLADVHDAVCADSVLVHEPAQLDEEPVRVGLLQTGLWSSFKHLAGFLKLRHMPRKSCFTRVSPGRTSSPSASSHSSTRPLIVTALRHRTSVTFMVC